MSKLTKPTPEKNRSRPKTRLRSYITWPEQMEKSPYNAITNKWVWQIKLNEDGTSPLFHLAGAFEDFKIPRTAIHWENLASKRVAFISSSPTAKYSYLNLKANEQEEQMSNEIMELTRAVKNILSATAQQLAGQYISFDRLNVATLVEYLSLGVRKLPFFSKKKGDSRIKIRGFIQ